MDILTGNLDEINFPDIVDGLVYAPGSINLKPFNRLTLEDFKNDFEINVLGAVKIIQKLLPNLKKSESASVVLFSSVAAKLGMPFHASISASKSAVEGLTKSLSAELSSQKIRVNAVAPSLTDTNLASQLLSTPENEKLPEKDILCKELEILKKLRKWQSFYYQKILPGLQGRSSGLMAEWEV